MVYFVCLILLGMGYFACLIILSKIWDKNYSGWDSSLRLSILRGANAFASHVFADDDGFASLKYSALRHMIACAISSLLMFVIDSTFLLRIILIMNSLYAVSKLLLQSRRKQTVSEMENERDYIKPSLDASKAVTVYAIYAAIVVFMCYVLR